MHDCDQGPSDLQSLPLRGVSHTRPRPALKIHVVPTQSPHTTTLLPACFSFKEGAVFRAVLGSQQNRGEVHRCPPLLTIHAQPCLLWTLRQKNN